MRGSDRLRQNIAALYRSPAVTQESILTTNGGIVANQIVLQALLSADDHVIVMYPTYEELYQTPRMLGAEVTLWKLTPSSSSPEDEWEWTLDLASLRSAIKPNTKMLVLNSPNNPTGAHLSPATQKEILAIAAEHDLIVFCDEVFYPLFRMEDPPSSFLDLNYHKAIVIGSLSKAYSLAGTRTGWIASANPELLDRCAAMRHYTTISVSQIDEAIAAEALADRCRLPLLVRANRLATTNIHALATFVDEHRGRCSWSKPVAGTTAMLLFTRDGRPVDDKEFCLRLLRRSGVLLCPVGALREMRRFMAEELRRFRWRRLDFLLVLFFYRER